MLTIINRNFSSFMFNGTAVLNTNCSFFCFSLTMAVQSCMQVKKDKINSIPVEKTVRERVSNIQQDTPKPFANYYTFNNALDTEKNIRYCWIDTFSIAKRRFRLLSDSKQVLMIEYYNDGTWHANITEQYFGWDFGINNEINDDGYSDLVIAHKLGLTIHFFNSATNLFDTVSWEMKHLDTLLERRRLIYYNWYSDIADAFTSELYTYKGIQPYYYYTLHYVYGGYVQGKPDAGFIGLWKYKNGVEDMDWAKLIKKIKLREDEHAEDYDYGKFWRDNSKTLLA